MKNITITLSDELTVQVRLAAAREGKSLSKFIADRLSRALGGHSDPLAPFDRWLSGPGWDPEGPPPPMREDSHEPAMLRGRADADLSPGPQRGAQAGADEA